MFKVRIFDSLQVKDNDGNAISNEDGKATSPAIFYHFDTAVPFVPVGGMRIGVGADSPGGNWEITCHRVMWNIEQERFDIHAKTPAHGADRERTVVEWADFLVSRGWKLSVGSWRDSEHDLSMLRERCEASV